MRKSIGVLVWIVFMAPGLICDQAAAAADAARSYTPMEAVKVLDKTLSSKHRKNLFIPFSDAEWFNFGWVPGTREGLGLMDIDNRQRNRLDNVLRSVLSPEGFKKIKNIILAESALAKIENAPSYRNPKKYWLAIFGKPLPDKLWGLRFEGHHLSLNVTLKGNQIISGMPSFIGTNPSKIPFGPHKGLRPLAREADAAWALYKSLTSNQQKEARVGDNVLGGLKSLAGTKSYNLGNSEGLSSVQMTERQTKLLIDVVKAYAEIMPESYSKPYLSSLMRRDINQMYFFWDGAQEPGGSYLFRIQGRRLLIEHDAHDNNGHIHSVWRDRGFDFGIETRWTRR